MPARKELVAIARHFRERIAGRHPRRPLARNRRGVARRSLLQWGALASLAFGSLAVAAWTQDRDAGRGTRDAGYATRNAAYAENADARHASVRLAQATGKTNELRPTPEAAESRTPNPESRAPSPSPRAPVLVTRRAELKNISAADFEAALEALTLRKVGVTELPEGDVSTFETSNDPASVRIYVARKSGKLSLQGPANQLDAWLKLIETIDVRMADRGSAMKVMSLEHAQPTEVRKTIAILQAATAPRRGEAPSGASQRSAEIAAPGGRRTASLISTLLQPAAAQNGQNANEQPAAGANQPANPRVDPNAAQPQPGDARQPAAQPGDQPTDQPNAQPGDQQQEELPKAPLGPVRIEYNEALDKLIVTGSPRDVEIVLELIRRLDEEAALTRPVVEVYELQHVENQALSTFISTIYTQVLESRQGTVSITPLVKPNALLIIGRKENVESVIELIKRFDQPVDAGMEFATFRLKHTSAFAVQRALREFYGDLVTFNQYVRTGLGAKAHVVVDYRTNTLFVQARVRDMAEVKRFIEEMDVATVEGNINQLRTIKLQNSLAQELAPIIQQAINGPAYQPPRVTGAQGQGQQQQQFQPQQQGQGGGQGTGQLQEAQALQARSVMLQLLARDENGERMVTSGILSDVRITAEPRGNALLVSAPPESMDLIVALIEQIDQLPPAEAQIKVFTIVNADAQTLANTLQTLFGQATGGQQGGGQFPGGGFNQQNFRIASADEEGGVLIPLRIAVEQRTNSIIVTGSAGDLAIVQALLVRLDDPDARERQTRVHRLKNSPAQNISDAINQYLTNQRTLQQQIGAQLIGTVEQFEREVIVVPEPVSNSLIVSATPRYFKEITELVEKLDERPPMVMIQVLIAEVVMRDVDEFGVELGVQDSILFDRSLAGLPGFAFNNAPLGNNTTVGGSDTVGTQSLSSFGVGRTNADLGFGGLVMSASSESISVLLRALQENRRLDVLSRPQVMTLDNQPAFIQVGQQVPYITGIANPSNTTGTTNFSTDLLDVGIILTVIPRISPDGLVVMEIDATKSAVGPDEEGIPISIAPNGDVIRSPRIDTQRAQTTVMAASGQTVILGGLITKRVSQVHRQLPWIGDIPYLGRLFSFDSESDERTELMIIMTPHVVRRESDNDLVKQVEGSRMSWCMADVYRIHGPGGPKGLGLGNGDEVPVFYPDENPAAPEAMPSPEATEPSVLNGGATNGGTINGGTYVSPPVNVQPAPDRPAQPVPPGGPSQPGTFRPPLEAPPPNAQPAPPLPNPAMTDRRFDTHRYDAGYEPRYDSRYAEPRDARYEQRYDSPRTPYPNDVRPANYSTFETPSNNGPARRLP